MKSEYDVLVIGGGPGGAVAAWTAARKGLSACLIEKRPAIGAPVRCAEGIGKKLLTDFLEPDPRWISADIKRARIVAPDGTQIQLKEDQAGAEVGYVLDRKFFDRELVWKASQAGADVFVKTRAVEPIIEDGILRGAVVESCGRRQEVRAQVTIAADGVESKFARWCGIDTTVPVQDLMSCIQYLVTDIDIDPVCNDFYLGNEVAPQGYLWVFAKGERCANVGIGIPASKTGPGNRAKDHLDRFMAEHFPDGKIIECVFGGDPVCRPLDCTVSDGLMIIGDAARVVDPITGGGIGNAMLTGRLAVEVAAKAIATGDTSKAALMPYDEGWRNAKMGRDLERNYKVKEFFIKLSDEKMNDLADSIANIDFDEFSVKALVLELIKRNPKMLFELKELKDAIKH
ncbi:NAD(P)/FAD-dependent oxidoreductase [Methanofollis aquaemaris]|uniref:Digeranylgeranylglycerophospholipid reductase n=1 Tax=Methanofollis aquaemaris TaxID=126734 RepID=A0A8A3S522_9EURY|nr:NAD(P)/FAD-dependent oxidoreductase [Methanofollis aquaemaris]QSZ66831.1 NAD(P)/FAD-dependent oxidoreductase [Methanofollis aquaemaris]